MTMYRSKANPRIDSQIFTHTAAKTKAVNLGYRVFRGGIRF